MPIPTPPQTRDLFHLDLQQVTQEELDRLKQMTDDELLRATHTMDLFSVTESMRRLKNALHREEMAIKWLTVVLVVLTLALVGLGIWALCR